jgi:hypothetical protein
MIVNANKFHNDAQINHIHKTHCNLDLRRITIILLIVFINGVKDYIKMTKIFELLKIIKKKKLNLSNDFYKQSCTFLIRHPNETCNLIYCNL